VEGAEEDKALLAVRPHRMVKIDNIRVLVLEGIVLVWMVMWFLSRPTLV
jgi:hypothetical protein